MKQVIHPIAYSLLTLWAITSTISTCNAPNKRDIDDLKQKNKELIEEIGVYEEALVGLRQREAEASTRAEEQLHLYEIQKHKYDSLANLLKRKPLPSRPNYSSVSNDSLIKLWAKHTR